MTNKTPSGKIFIGIDVSKAHLDIYIHPLSKQFCIDNNAKSISKWLKNHVQPGAVVIFEATGGYERTLQKEILKHSDITAQRIHPSRVKSFARAFGKQAKTDAIDAQMLARAGEQLADSLHNTAICEVTQELRDLLARRTQLQDILHAEKCRSKMECLSKVVIRDLKTHIAYLKKRMAAIEDEVRALIAAHPALKTRSQRLQNVVGVGEKVAMTLLAFLPELGTVDRKKIAAIAGLAPITKQSGKGAGYARTKGGRQPLKKAIYMAALVGIRYNKTLKTFYQSLLEKRKPKMVALIATAKKLLLHLNAIEKNAPVG